MKLMLLMSENGRILGRGPICRRLVYNGSVRTTCKKRGQFVLQFKMCAKIIAARFPNPEQGLNAVTTFRLCMALALREQENPAPPDAIEEYLRDRLGQRVRVRFKGGYREKDPQVDDGAPGVSGA